MIKNTLPDESGNAETLKDDSNSLKAFQLMFPYLTKIG